MPGYVRGAIAPRIFAVAALLALPVAGCSVRLSSSGKSASESAVRAVLEAQQAAWNAGDIEGFMEGYHRSPETVFASGGTITYGWDAVTARYLERYDSREKMGRLTFTIHRIDSLGEHFAKVLGAWELERGQDDVGGLFTLIFQEFPDGWRIIHDHTSLRES